VYLCPRRANRAPRSRGPHPRPGVRASRHAQRRQQPRGHRLLSRRLSGHARAEGARACPPLLRRWHRERGRERQVTTTPDYSAPHIVQTIYGWRLADVNGLVYRKTQNGPRSPGAPPIPRTERSARCAAGGRGPGAGVKGYRHATVSASTPCQAFAGRAPIDRIARGPPTHRTERRPSGPERTQTVWPHAGHRFFARGSGSNKAPQCGQSVRSYSSIGTDYGPRRGRSTDRHRAGIVVAERGGGQGGD
jgi:hypothetical protein